MTGQVFIVLAGICCGVGFIAGWLCAEWFHDTGYFGGGR